MAYVEDGVVGMVLTLSEAATGTVLRLTRGISELSEVVALLREEELLETGGATLRCADVEEGVLELPFNSMGGSLDRTFSEDGCDEVIRRLLTPDPTRLGGSCAKISRAEALAELGP